MNNYSIRERFEAWYLSSCLDAHEELPAWIAWQAALSRQASLKWNAAADEFNQWSTLGQDEKDELMLEIQEAIAALSSIKPSDPVAIVDGGDDGLFGDILPDQDLKIGQELYATPPDYEALKEQLRRSESDNTRLQSQYDEMRMKCSRIPVVAENEAIRAENEALKAELNSLVPHRFEYLHKDGNWYDTDGLDYPNQRTLYLKDKS